MSEKYLDETLNTYCSSDAYPFHMPGHKRQSLDLGDPYAIDITEIDGFDNLHHAKGIINEAQERAAQMYGAKKSFFLINGSSCGILSAICATCKKGDRILVARNCHKSVFHAILLQELEADYLYPQETESGIQGQISAEDVKQKLSLCKEYKAILITSPTYDGIVSDVKEIAKMAHSYGIPLIVDEAHGAHFGFHKAFPINAGRCGADVVIMSMHKTLPSLTQTALLHIYGDQSFVLQEKIAKYLAIFETSSPSYVFMAGMDKCLRFIREKGDDAFSSYSKRLDKFYDDVSDLKNIKLLTKDELIEKKEKEAFDFDKGKLVIQSKKETYSGSDLMKELREDYHLELEMAAGNYALAMTSIMDKDEGFERLQRALHEIDLKLDDFEEKKKESYCPYQEMEGRMTIAEADRKEGVAVSIRQAVGRISKAYLYLYPPGIPLIVPGELVSLSLIEALEWCQEKGLCLEGLEEDQSIKVVN